MKRILVCLAAFSLTAACKKSADTDKPSDDKPATTDADKPAPVTTEPDPPAIAEARAKYIAGQYGQVIETMKPLVDDLKSKEKARASGLGAAWLSLALAEDVVENAKEPADHAQAMAEQTGDPEVKIAAKLAQGAYKLKTEDFAGAAADFEEAYNLQKDGPNAGLALVMYGNTKINLAFGGEDNAIVNPGELDSAASTFVKAQRLVEKQPGNELLGARALEGQAAVVRYKDKKNTPEACRLIAEAAKIYTTKGAGQPLIDAANALQDEANCGPAPAAAK
ncbi:hypothetical protein [Nannocystis bainbridge]|uniref:Tetratricopeptide repeat protein n=1 Tax=Nannocystis bainbridge TaxID=2995303 RepID=A0ABT5ECP5_9BACT|nr:hypothetical protein [Nannocystis bainbridge]MDC0718732.1 hypothetical protein [Nannocystis bainbridge]MDC0718748.1 hypothetical protein [Nannocystis bainbridge]MDC0722612.1 hypothetical protein [Nannocystis bainbridge]